MTPPSQDAGVDIVATKELPLLLKVVIQAKRYSSASKVSSPEIQQYSSLRRQEENVDAVAVVTTAGFTEQARRTTEALNVKLLDVHDIREVIEDTSAHDLLDSYVDGDVAVPTNSTPDREIINGVPPGNKTESELESHLVEGYGLFDMVLGEYYREEETVLLVHSSPDSPVWTHDVETETLDVDTETTEHGSPVHLHLTSEGIRIFARRTNDDAHYFADYDTIVDVRADSALFGPNESVRFDLGGDGTIEYKFRSMTAEV